MTKLPVAVLFGGRGAEREISRASAKFILSVLADAGVPTLPVRIESDGAFLLPSGEETFPVLLGKTSGFLTKSGLLPVLCAIPALHGDHGEDGEVQGLLTAAKIPFVGAGVLAGAVTADKAYTKRIAASLGIPVLPDLVFDGESKEDALAATEAAIPYPVFVKPARLGSSIGAGRAENGKRFLSAYDAARRAGGRVLVEPALEKPRELEVAYLDLRGGLFAGPGEIVPGDVFYSYSDKYESKTAKIDTSPRLPEGVASRVREYSRLLVKELGLRHLSRIDYFHTGSGEIFFNEINPFPGFTGISLYPRLLAAEGISGKSLLLHLVALAAEAPQ